MTQDEALQRAHRVRNGTDRRKQTLLDKLDAFAAAIGYAVMLLGVIAGLLSIANHWSK